MSLSSLGHTKRASRNRIRLAALAVLAVFLSAPAHAPAGEQAFTPAPDSLSDAEFWKFFTNMSEEGGYFLSENFVSNEMTFQDVIPTLQKSLTRNGVYLGVGPEQNFTYIANLQPRMAVIFDIRRQNAMHHLMYKALFELSPTREEFVARLFSRPGVGRLTPGIAVRALFDSAEVAPASDSAYTANVEAIVDQLVKKHGFALPANDIETIRHVYDVFYRAGPLVNYGYRGGGPAYRGTYPTFGMLQGATNADSVEMAFLATETNYQAVRQLQLKNLIVPVVGDFGGPSAIRAVGSWLRDRKMTVTAFYVSNVEQYLFRETGQSERFYANVSALPHDTTSRFIRSVPGNGGMPMMFSMTSSTRGSVNGVTRVEITRDASGTTTRTYRDSAGVTVVTTTRDTMNVDSTMVRLRAARDSVLLQAVRNFAGKDSALQQELRAMNARRDSISNFVTLPVNTMGAPTFIRGGGLLTSGLASIDGTLRAYFLGDLKTYNDVIEMTKVTGWK